MKKNVQYVGYINISIRLLKKQKQKQNAGTKFRLQID